MMATKEQERKALEKIRNIVAELGEGSYIATAFEGCFDIAEENIDNDFACSMKSRVDALKKENAHLKDSLNALHSTIDDLNKENKELKRKVLTTTEAGAIKAILNHAQLEAAGVASKAANRIVEYADDPSSKEFCQAVRDNRQAQKRLDECQNLIRRLLETMS